MPLNYDEVDALAATHYAPEPDDRSAPLFCLLVDVADRYVSVLEEEASHHPAPFFAGATPMQAAMNGLIENLEMKRDGTLEQYR